MKLISTLSFVLSALLFSACGSSEETGSDVNEIEGSPEISAEVDYEAIDAYLKTLFDMVTDPEVTWPGQQSGSGVQDQIGGARGSSQDFSALRQAYAQAMATLESHDKTELQSYVSDYFSDNYGTGPKGSIEGTQCTNEYGVSMKSTGDLLAQCVFISFNEVMQCAMKNSIAVAGHEADWCRCMEKTYNSFEGCD